MHLFWRICREIRQFLRKNLNSAAWLCGKPTNSAAQLKIPWAVDNYDLYLSCDYPVNCKHQVTCLTTLETSAATCGQNWEQAEQDNRDPSKFPTPAKVPGLMTFYDVYLSIFHSRETRHCNHNTNWKTVQRAHNWLKTTVLQHLQKWWIKMLADDF